MSFRLSFFFLFLWASIALLVQVGNLAVAPDTAFFNTIGSGSVLEVEDVNFGGNILNAAVEAISWAAGTVTAVLNLATFNSPFWDGPTQIVRWLLFSTLGGALVLSLGWETMRLMRG